MVSTPVLSEHRLLTSFVLKKKVHACFSSVDYAAQALNVDRSVVRNACKSFGEEPFLLDKHLPFCQLRYARESKAYEYGAHARDFFSCEETHKERLERWAKLQETSRGHHIPPETINIAEGDDDSTSDWDGSVSQTQNSHDRGSLRKKGNMSKRTRDEQHNTFSNKSKIQVGAHRDEESRLISKSRKNGILSFLNGGVVVQKNRQLCIACQTHQSAVVLEPCHHQMLCHECAKKWCPRVCPRCIVPIRHRVDATSCIWIHQ